MSEHDIINGWELVQTERERWADKLAPKHIPGDDCCTYGDCTGGYGCPVRQTPVDGMCEASGVQCVTPWTCSPLCQLITANGGQQVEDGLPIQMFEPRRWYQPLIGLYIFLAGLALVRFGLAVYQTF